MRAHYLVTTWAAATADAHQLLETLLFAALDTPAYTVEPAPFPPASWAAFGVPPQPGFALSALVQRARPQPPVPRVRRPLEVETAPLVTLSGRVLGPDDIPLPDAYVELPALQRGVRTDGRGRFVLTAVPTQPPTTHLRVHAKGATQAVAVKLDQVGDAGLTVRFDALDGP